MMMSIILTIFCFSLYLHVNIMLLHSIINILDYYCGAANFVNIEKNVYKASVK